MARYDLDLFVIGAGSGGVRAARTAASLGARVAIAEERYLGGTCVNVGCVPKKLFVYAAHFSEDFASSRGFGWCPGAVEFDWQTLLNNKNKEIARLNSIYRDLLKDSGAELINGRVRLVDQHSVRVNNKTHTAARILVATGAWPSIPDLPGNEHVLSSNEIFFIKRLPQRIIIVGGGYIAVEFAGIFKGLGVDTTLLYRGPLFLRGFDHEIRTALATEMQKKGVTLKFNTTVGGIEKSGEELIATLSNKETSSNASQRADLILYATGRRPNTAGLGLAEAGVALDDSGAVIINEHYQSSVDSIYAIGDVTDRINLTPVATAEGTALARALYAGGQAQVDYQDIPTCVFSQPNLGAVGLTEEKAREQYQDIAVYTARFTAMKHSLGGSDEKTFMKIIVDQASDRVVGVHVLGADAGEIIQGLAIAMKAGATKAQFDATIGIHPTTAEELVTMREAVSRH